MQIEADLVGPLEALALGGKTSKSQIVSSALRDYLERDGRRQLDQLFQGRLDRMSLQLGRIERDSLVLIETLAVLTRYLLTLYALEPEFDLPRRAAGQDRFEAFVDEVGRQLMRGKTLVEPILSASVEEEAPS